MRNRNKILNVKGPWFPKSYFDINLEARASWACRVRNQCR